MNLTIDTISLQEYIALSKGNKDFMKILLEKVARQLEEYEPLITEDIQKQDLKSLREHTHYIKPMLVSLKLTQMLGLFEELKQQMEHAEISQDKLQQSVHYLGKAFQDIRKQVNIELNAL